MDASYTASVTDCPTYSLSITIDGHATGVHDYVGEEVGMPAIITELEDEVDALARTHRWIDGGDGLVPALRAEKFTFQTFEAQVMLKEAARRGKTATVREFLEAGVPLKPLPHPMPKEPYRAVPFEHVGWLNAASGHPETLQVLINAAASKSDQGDRDLALAGAARSGSIMAVRALIAYGANPNVGSVLIYAAESGNPEMVREILRYHPKLETRDREGKTAMFAAADYRSGDVDGARVECVRLLVQAGADVNARDERGNTPLHETFLTDVEEELLRLGADVNARNKEGETPIFTTFDDDAIPLFIKYGADLTIRNKEGKTVIEAAQEEGSFRPDALRKAIQKLDQR